MENTIDLQAERAAIAAERAALNQREIAIDEVTLVDDEAKHQALIAQCREAKDAYEQLDEQTKAAQYKAQNTEAAYKRVEWDLEMYRTTTRPPAFPSAEETKAWQEELRVKVEASEAAEKASADAWEPCNRLQHQRKVEQEKLQKLLDEELASRGRLEAMRRSLAARKPGKVAQWNDPVPEKQTIVFSMDSFGPRSANRMPMNMTPV